MSQSMDNLSLANVSRRGFLKGLAASGALVLAARWDLAAAADAPKYGADAMPNGWVDNPDAFVSIAPDGSVTIISHRAEMGQGIRTSLLMVVADEMGADWNRVKVEQAIAHEEKYGNQNTDGSRSMRHFFEPMRRCGAAARTMLVQAAAARWGVEVADCIAEVHQVRHQPSGRTLGFGDLAASAAELPVPSQDKITLKPAQEWRYIHRSPEQMGNTAAARQPKAIDGWDIVRGKARYAADVYWDDMLYAVIARPPSYGSAVKSVDDSAALKVPGVVKVVTLPTTIQPSAFAPLGGVAVLASNTWAAIQGRNALKIEWDNGPAGDNARYDSVAYKAHLERQAEQPGKLIRQQGDMALARKGAEQALTVNYYAPHMAQAPMEPPAAIARIEGDKVEVWTSVQNPQLARDGVAGRLQLKPENVTIHCALLGGGFGRKAKPDYVFEAVDLSRIMGGRPVRVQWTREDDLHHSFFHTVALEHLQASLTGGKVKSWLHRSVSPSISSLFAPNAAYQSDMELAMGVRNMPFAIPAITQEAGEAMGHVRIGWFRSVYNIPHAFAIQSFVAELAQLAGRDHRDFLLELIGPARKIDPRSQGEGWNYGENPELYPIDTGRYRDVILRATSEAGWGKKLPKNRGLGLAVHHSFVSYCAVVMEVEVDEAGKVKVHRADIAFDCGPQINPDRVRAQLEGACVMGTGIALMTEITAANGRIQQDNFHQYLVPRISEAPFDIRVHAVNSDFNQPLGGAGEPGLPPIAPALCNAIFAATGKRIRSLPVADQLAAS